MPSEIEKFQRDLLESVKQMKRGEAVRTTKSSCPRQPKPAPKWDSHSRRLLCCLASQLAPFKTGSKGAGHLQALQKHFLKLLLHILRFCVNCVHKCVVLPNWLFKLTLILRSKNFRYQTMKKSLASLLLLALLSWAAASPNSDFEYKSTFFRPHLFWV